MLVVVWIEYNRTFELKIILTYASGYGPLKIQRQVFVCENVGGWGLNMKTFKVRKRGRKEGKRSLCYAFRIAFSKCLPRLTPSTGVHVKL
jgi:hypothetical protein